MMELIQYEPTTEKVRKVPLLLLPPWVNKYYLFDLQPRSSFIKWAVDQGFTVFRDLLGKPGRLAREEGFRELLAGGTAGCL